MLAEPDLEPRRAELYKTAKASFTDLPRCFYLIHFLILSIYTWRLNTLGVKSRLEGLPINLVEKGN